MADDLNKRGGRDRQRIDVGQEHELRSWSEKFGVTRETLKEAVQAVGDDASKVEQHLRDRGGRAGGSGSERR
jgi:predicted nucleotidyltransferase